MLRYVVPAIAALLLPATAFAGSLSITVAGVRNAAGSVRAAVYDEASFLDDVKRIAGATAPATAGEVTLVVPELPAGRYAVAVFHDENANGRLEKSFLGAPTEGFGVSNDARGSFGPPGFSAAAFTIGGADSSIRIRLNY